MKNLRKIAILLVLVMASLLLVSCAPYTEEAGVYECYEITLNSQDCLSSYEYYRITLEANGTCIVESKGADNSSAYKATATFSIKDNKITVVTTNGAASVTEVYDYIDGEIIMDTTVSGYTMYAKFARVNGEE